MESGNFADAQLRALIDVAAVAAGAYRLEEVLELAADRALEALDGSSQALSRGEPDAGRVRTRVNVRASRRNDLVSPLVTSRKRPPLVNPTSRPPGIGRDRRSSRASESRRETSTSSGGELAPDTTSPVTKVRPSGEKATSAVTALGGEVATARRRCVRRSTRMTWATRPFVLPTASVRSSGLNASARTGRTIAPK